MIDGVEKVLKEKGKLIEKEIEGVIPRKGIPNLHDAIWYHMGTGGKRIRPVLAIMACEAMGGKTDKVLPFAASCEIMHNWFLVHDDIEDGDEIRRGQPAVWKRFGKDHGINIGDYMSEKVYALIFSSLKRGVNESTVIRLIEETIFTCSRTAEGQTMDMNLRRNDSPTERDYFQSIEGKTAYYFMHPIIGGCIVAGAKDDVIKKVREFGLRAGPAFQIADDLLDLTEGKGRDEIGCDIKEGKRTLMAVNCYDRCSLDERNNLIRILNKPREQTSKEDVLWVKELFERHDSMDYAAEKARSLVSEAKEIISDLPEELKNILDQFADYLIERKK
ncbi:MAG: polyprenyl synthetase family protein [Candidatus Aenigmarchaeota archaeon]|nr:polyprenyl synthetase family protein [Candidatus Aenigmarchaeota archaeon]